MHSDLSRSLRPRHIRMISIGGIIGAGLFVGSSAAIASTGPAIIFSYLICGTLILLIMRMLGEMAVALPNVRSFTEFVRAGLGSAGGFVAGWLYWYFWIMVVPVEAIAGANILHAWIPAPPWQIGLLLMAVMTGVNLMSARSYGELEFWFSSIKVSAIVAFIILGACKLVGWAGAPTPVFQHLHSGGGFLPHGIDSVLAGAVTVFFALTGAEITTVAAAESAEPARAIAQMTTSVIFRILIFYVFSISLIVSIVPWALVRVGESPFTLALSYMGYRWASTAMSWVILTAVLSCLNSAFYVCSRVLFQLAAHGDAPVGLVVTNRRGVPARSVCLGTFAGVAGVLAATLAPGTVFAFLVDASGALMVFVYIMVAIAQIRLRVRRERAGGPSPAIQMWGFPWISLMAIAAMVAILVALATNPGHARELAFSLVTLGVTCLVYSLKRGRTRKLASGPEFPAF
jgi:GABA permease